MPIATVVWGMLKRGAKIAFCDGCHRAVARDLYNRGQRRRIGVAPRLDEGTLTMGHAASITAAATVSAILFTGSAAPAQEITLDVAHAFGFQRTMHEEIARRFMADNPDIAVVLRPTADNYEMLVQRTLRESLVGTLPDIAYHGFNRVQAVAEHAIALTPFIAAEPDFDALGYSEAALALSQVDGVDYGLPFSISTPILYFNAGLVRRAGGDPDAFPTTWDGILDLAAAINALDQDIIGGYLDWTSSGNWEFIALVESRGGDMIRDGHIAFDGPEGRFALDLLARFGREAGQIDMSDDQAMQAFVAGTIGILQGSSSRIVPLTDQIDDFTLGTAPFPVSGHGGRLPAGGAAAVMFADDPQAQAAAWRYMTFATGPIGQTIMVDHTGNVPGNTAAVHDPRLLGPVYQANPNMMTPVHQLPLQTAYFTFPGTNGIRLHAAIREILRAVVTRQQTPEAAMAAMVAAAEQMLEIPN